MEKTILNYEDKDKDKEIEIDKGKHKVQDNIIGEEKSTDGQDLPKKKGQ